MMKHSKHKQKKYYTLMLVPYYSGRTRSLRVSGLAFHILTIILIGIICAFLIFYIRTNYFQSLASEINNSLQQSQKQSTMLEQAKSLLEQDVYELEKESENLSRQLKEAENKGTEAAARELESYEQKIKLYEQKATELEEKLKELQKAREDVYNQLSSQDFTPPVTEAGFSANATPVFTNMSYNITLDAKLEQRYASLEAGISHEMDSYNELLNHLQKAERNKANYPTIWPVKGIVTSEVGYRQNPFGGTGDENHTGIDIAVPMYTDVKASGNGLVKFVGVMNGYGNLVIISHDMGVESYYAHNSSILVSQGEWVQCGQVIAKAGSTGLSTGPHVHFEVRVNGIVENPRNYIKEDM